MTFEIQKLNDYPTQPGVYLMKDAKDHVLYVGKAKNLRQRIKQYFLPGRDTREMIPFLVSKIDNIETVVVFSEKEALLLENNLIKQHRPRYNALLKDDKSYLALKVTTKSTWPKVELVRYQGRPKPDGVYFGPYTSAHSAREVLDLLQRIFPLRQCSDAEFARRTRPCILYDMQRCIAPCVGKCTKEDYQNHVTHLLQFLKGQNQEILKDLHSEMEDAAERLEFERAQALLQTIRHIERTVETQHVDRPLGQDADVVGLYRQGDEVVLALMVIRNGKLLGSRHFSFSKILEEPEELISSFLIQHYEALQEVPHEIVVPLELSDQKALEELLSTNRPRQASILFPQRGDKKKWLEMAALNAEAAFKQTKDQKAIIEKTLISMQEQLHLQHFPRRIECMDISNLSGSETVAAMIAFTDGEKDKNRYRRFKINSADASDDYGAMEEVLTRRCKRAQEENDLPDLLIVDGGKGHLNMALKVLGELNIISVDVIGIAKEAGRHDRGMTVEKVFLPQIKDPIILKAHSPVLFLLQKIRDEAHRFAITYQRNRRSKTVIKSILDDIPGIGPLKKRALLRHLGSVTKIKEASTEDLKKVPSIHSKDAEVIWQFFHKT